MKIAFVWSDRFCRSGHICRLVYKRVCAPLIFHNDECFCVASVTIFHRCNYLYIVYSFSSQGYYKVLGKGILPKQPLIVKARFFSRKAEKKIKEVGGACVLTAWSEQCDTIDVLYPDMKLSLEVVLTLCILCHTMLVVLIARVDATSTQLHSYWVLYIDLWGTRLSWCPIYHSH